MKAPGTPSSLAPKALDRPAIDDYAGRYAVCYELLADQQGALLEDMDSGKITGEEFNELWNDVQTDFEACREQVDNDHDMFEFDPAEYGVGMKWIK